MSSKILTIEDLVVGQEYLWLGMFVTVTDIEFDRAVVQTRFGDFATIHPSELQQKENLEFLP